MAFILLVAFLAVLAAAKIIVDLNSQKIVYQQKGINDLYAAGIQNKIAEYRNTLLVLAGAKTLQNSSEFGYANPHDRGAPQNRMAAERQRLNDLMQVEPSFYAMQLADQNGMNLIIEPYFMQSAVTAKRYGKTYKGTQWFQAAYSENQEYLMRDYRDTGLLKVAVTAPYIDELYHQPTIAMSVPIRFDNGSIGVLAGRIGLDSIGGGKMSAEEGAWSSSFAVDSDGNLVVYPDDKNYDRSTIYNLSDNAVVSAVLKDHLRQRKISAVYDPDTRRAYDVFYTYDAQDDWYFITRLDRQMLVSFSESTYGIGILFYISMLAIIFILRNNLNLKRKIGYQKLIAAAANSTFNFSSGLQNYFEAVLERLTAALPLQDAAIVDFGRGKVYAADGQHVCRPPDLREAQALLKLFESSRIIEKVPADNQAAADCLSRLCMTANAAEGALQSAFYGFVAEDTVIGLLLFRYNKADHELLPMVESIGLSMETTLGHKLHEQQTFVERDRLRITLESIGDGVLVTDSSGKITMINDVASKLTGYPPQEAVGRDFAEVFDIYSEQTGARSDDPVKRVLQTGKIIGLANHTCLRSRDGTVYSIADSAAPIRNEGGATFGVIVVFRDITENKRHEEEIIYLNYHDNLTGAHNRNYFDKNLPVFDSAENLPVSVIMGDVNGLKLINDVFGHEEGDKLLQSIARVLLTSCREQDKVFRWGGDEFIVIMPKTDAQAAADMCRKISLVCEELNRGGANRLKTALSISTGYAAKTDMRQDIMLTIKQAEDFMYTRKLLESRSLHNSIITSIRRTLNEKNFETEKHAGRLQAICRKLGAGMKLPEEKISELELLALLHDIGKIAINDNILTKPGALTDEEWQQMRRHSEIGYRMAMASPEIRNIAEYILAHHERWDGRGYPQGLKGEEIPLLARIIAVVDSYDAMTHDRVYHKGISKQAAIEEIAANAGKQFDPTVVGAFISTINDMEE